MDKLILSCNWNTLKEFYTLDNFLIKKTSTNVDKFNIIDYNFYFFNNTALNDLICIFNSFKYILKTKVRNINFFSLKYKSFSMYNTLFFKRYTISITSFFIKTTKSNIFVLLYNKVIKKSNLLYKNYYNYILPTYVSYINKQSNITVDNINFDINNIILFHINSYNIILKNMFDVNFTFNNKNNIIFFNFFYILKKINWKQINHKRQLIDNFYFKINHSKKNIKQNPYYKILFFNSGGFDKNLKKSKKNGWRVKILCLKIKLLYIKKSWSSQSDFFFVVTKGVYKRFRIASKVLRSFFWSIFDPLKDLVKKLLSFYVMKTINVTSYDKTKFDTWKSFFKDVSIPILSDYSFDESTFLYFDSFFFYDYNFNNYLDFFILIFFLFFIKNKKNNNNKFFFFIMPIDYYFFYADKIYNLKNNNLIKNYTRTLFDKKYIKYKKVYLAPWRKRLSKKEIKSRFKIKENFFEMFCSNKIKLINMFNKNPLIINIVDQTTYPFNGCTRAKRHYIRKKSRTVNYRFKKKYNR